MVAPAERANTPRTGAGETRALIWFRSALAVDSPESDRRIRWLFDTTRAVGDHAATRSMAGMPVAPVLTGRGPNNPSLGTPAH
jgi:hypothetical protein